jgi:hypothetical protein
MLLCTSFYSLGLICHAGKPLTEVKIDQNDGVTGFGLDGSSVPFLYISASLAFFKDECV